MLYSNTDLKFEQQRVESQIEATLERIRREHPDHNVRIKEVHAEGEKVVVDWILEPKIKDFKIVGSWTWVDDVEESYNSKLLLLL